MLDRLLVVGRALYGRLLQIVSFLENGSDVDEVEGMLL